jgi:hypothetical protein
MKLASPPRAGLAAPQVSEAARRLEAWGASRGWTGTDPYDGLNATRLAGLLRRSVAGRKILTQAVKRSPLNLRPVLGISPGRSAAAVAAVVSAYARNGFLPAEEAAAKLSDAVRLLESLRCEGFDELCWGYHFDVQTRVFFYPRGAPNAIATAFAGMALLDAHERTEEAAPLEQAVSACEFFLRHVPRTEAGEGSYFGYLVGDRTPIHNANMLVCALLARAGRHTGQQDFLDAADAGVAYTLAHQADDGSWPYGEQPHLRWVDGFHTGYVLDALRVCVQAGLPSARPDALDRGLAFYRRALFLEDGTPKYTIDSTYPVDIQCVAQGIQTFALAGDAWALRVFEFALTRMRRADGAFAFQRRRLWRNDIPHVRWGQAPMLLALTHLLRTELPE